MLTKAEAVGVVATAALVLLSRLAHTDLVWVEEAYGLAAARQLLDGRGLYRDIWFDKPPLYALYYASFGALAGVPLRLAGTAVVLLTAASAAAAAHRIWGSNPWFPAFFLVCVHLTLWIPAAVIAVTPDVLMIAPQFLAIFAAAAGRGVLAGVCAGIALWANSKGLIVLLYSLLWCWRRPLPVFAGFAAVQSSGLLLVDINAFWNQVWAWGARYSGDTFVASPLVEFLRRTAGWMWFHGTLVAGAAVALWNRPEGIWRYVVLLALSLTAIVTGLRFFPRYYFVLLPPAILLAAKGVSLVNRRGRIAMLSLLLIPAARFGPRYLDLLTGSGHEWSDLALMQDSQAVADTLRGLADPDDTLLVWGYRPDIYVFSGLGAGTRFLDSQPLTGVLADRHLTNSRPTFATLAERHRKELEAEENPPHFIVDGLGPLNPELGVERYGDLRGLISRYREVSRTRHSVIYQLQEHSLEMGR
ncbi:MAG TPA: hypothetical protein VES20_09525 [Bryobacteraceae bacterium]|nr:hypothetical protein [Bryobacteraceae bacterium]